MTGKRDIQPRLKRILTEAGLRVAIMRSKSVKTRDRLDWIKKNGSKCDVVISHPQLVQTGLDFFGKGEDRHNFNSIQYVFIRRATTLLPCNRQLVVLGGLVRPRAVASHICITRAPCSNGRWP